LETWQVWRALNLARVEHRAPNRIKKTRARRKRRARVFDVTVQVPLRRAGFAVLSLAFAPLPK
jgi:tRNA U54 and U55 pseudouridine synthase Pus10